MSAYVYNCVYLTSERRWWVTNTNHPYEHFVCIGFYHSTQAIHLSIADLRMKQFVGTKYAISYYIIHSVHISKKVFNQTFHDVRIHSSIDENIKSVLVFQISNQKCGNLCHSRNHKNLWFNVCYNHLPWRMLISDLAL